MGADGQWGDNNHQGMFEFPGGSGRHWFAYHTRKLSRERGEYLGYERNVALDRLYFLLGPSDEGAGRRGCPGWPPSIRAPLQAPSPSQRCPLGCARCVSRCVQLPPNVWQAALLGDER